MTPGIWPPCTQIWLSTSTPVTTAELDRFPDRIEWLSWISYTVPPRCERQNTRVYTMVNLRQFVRREERYNRLTSVLHQTQKRLDFIEGKQCNIHQQCPMSRWCGIRDDGTEVEIIQLADDPNSGNLDKCDWVKRTPAPLVGSVLLTGCGQVCTETSGECHKIHTDTARIHLHTVRFHTHSEFPHTARN